MTLNVTDVSSQEFTARIIGMKVLEYWVSCSGILCHLKFHRMLSLLICPNNIIIIFHFVILFFTIIYNTIVSQS